MGAPTDYVHLQLHHVEWFVEAWGAGRESAEGEVACVSARSSCRRLVTRTRASEHGHLRATAISETNFKRAGNTLAVKPVQLRSLTFICRARERGSVQE